jgi:hypothetical protein
LAKKEAKSRVSYYLLVNNRILYLIEFMHVTVMLLPKKPQTSIGGVGVSGLFGEETEKMDR